MDFANYITAQLHKEYSGEWSISAEGILKEIYLPSRDEIITVEEEEYRVVNPTKKRDADDQELGSFEARHVLFDLEDIYVSKGKMEATHNLIASGHEGTMPYIDYEIDAGWVVGYQLKGTITDHLSKLFEFAPEAFSFVLDLTAEEEDMVRTVTVSAGSIWGNLRRILDRFNFGFLPNSYGLTVTSRNKLLESLSSADLYYSINNIDMERQLHYDDTISKVYATAEAVIEPDEEAGECEPRGDLIREDISKIVGSGYPEYHIDFGEIEADSIAEAEDELEALANEYLSVRNDPVARYTVGVAEIKFIEGYEEYEFDVAEIVDVHDPDIGSGQKIVVGYEYSLLDSMSEKMTATVNLGRLPEERIPSDREVFQINNLSFASNVLDFLENELLGGTVKDVEEDLHIQADIEYLECSNRKTLHGMADVLRDIVNEDRSRPTIDAHDSEDFRVYDLMGAISAKRKQFLPIIQDFFETYIDVSLGTSSDGIIVNRINDIYKDFFPKGLDKYWPPYSDPEITNETVISIEPTSTEEPLFDAEEIWGSDFNSYELEVAQAILDYAVNAVGDITKIHKGLGGGSNGLVPAINELHRLFSEWSDRVAGRLSHSVIRFLQGKITGGNADDLVDELIYMTDSVKKDPLRPEFFRPDEDQEYTWPPESTEEVEDKFIFLSDTIDTCQRVLDDQVDPPEFMQPGDLEYSLYDPTPKIQAYKYIMPNQVLKYIEEGIDLIVGETENLATELNTVFDNWFRYGSWNVYDGKVQNPDYDPDDPDSEEYIDYEGLEIGDNRVLVDNAEGDVIPVFLVRFEYDGNIEYARVTRKRIYDREEQDMEENPEDFDELSLSRGVLGTTEISVPPTTAFDTPEPEAKAHAMPHAEQAFEGDIPQIYMPLAQAMLDYITNNVGNPTDVYLQLGGGVSGFIPAINRMYDLAESRRLDLIEEETMGDEQTLINLQRGIQDLFEAMTEFLNGVILGGNNLTIDSELRTFSTDTGLTVETYDAGGSYNNIKYIEDFTTVRNCLDAVEDFINDEHTLTRSSQDIIEPVAYVAHQVMPYIHTFYSDESRETQEFHAAHKMRGIFYDYISSVVGEKDIDTPTVVDRLNDLYVTAHQENNEEYGTTVDGRSIDQLPDSVHSVIESENFANKPEWRSAVRAIVNEALDNCGNPTEVYMELDSGENGIIPAVNNFFNNVKRVQMKEVNNGTVDQEKRKNPRIYTSSDDPDDTIGNDGDIWLRFDAGGDE